MNRRVLWIAGLTAVVLIAGYFIATALVRKKIETALHALPPGVTFTYTSLELHLLSGRLTLGEVYASWQGQRVSVKKLEVGGIRYAALLHHRLDVRAIHMEGCSVDLDERMLEKQTPLPEMTLPFSAVSIGEMECKAIRVTLPKDQFFLEGEAVLDSLVEEGGNWGMGAMRFSARRVRYVIPDTKEALSISGITLDSKAGLMKMDTVRVLPTENKEEIGRMKGHQVDVVESTTEGVVVEGLDVKALMKRSLVAARVSVRRNTIYIFRDRRLPLAPGDKALPMDGLESLPVTLRVGSVRLGSTFFAYEEYPKKGKETGILKIYRLHGTLEPLINHPGAGDPAYLTMRMEGSLMNSGSVTATTRMPLHKGDAYSVEGTFHQLDVTRLNNPAENLGGLHLESGMLNSLEFQFEMTKEGSSGHIIGEYHDLVVDKLKGNGDEKKIDQFKSFALKKFIIPKDKDKSLPVKKRTGKVKYKRDPQRYFSYYLLHSLLVGVKSSFSLGFLLPG